MLNEGDILHEYMGKGDFTAFEIDDICSKLLIALESPSKDELAELMSADVEMRVTQFSNLLLLSFRFGRFPWIDAPFTLRLCMGLTGKYDLAMLCKRINIMIVDTADGRILSLTELNVSDRFAKDFADIAIAAAGDSFDKEQYNVLKDNVEAVYSPEQVADLAMLRFATKDSPDTSDVISGEFEVGAKLPGFDNGAESSAVDLLENAINLYVCYNHDLVERVHEIIAGTLDVRVTTLREIVWICVKFGNLDWIAAPYNPNFNLDNAGASPVRLSEACRLLNVIVIDTMSGCIKYVGNLAFPDAFTKQITDVISPLFDIQISEQEYMRQAREILDMYTPEDIADMSDIEYRPGKEDKA